MRVLFNTAGIFNNNTGVKKREYFTSPDNMQNAPQNLKIPDYKSLKANYLPFINLNFNARIKAKKFLLMEYRNSISCPCCGEKMKDFDTEHAQSIAEEIAPKKGEELAQALYSNMKEFQASKRKLAAVIARFASNNPDLEFSEILNKISDDYRERLRMKQIAVVIDLTNDIMKRYPKKEAQIEKWRYQQIKQAINSEDEGEFRNKALTDMLIKFNRDNKIKIPRSELEPYFSRLPNSKKDNDAFVVKYKRRSSEEGIYSLIKHTTATIEHIDPYCSSNNNDFNNLLLMCADCNNARGVAPYRDFLDEHPEMIKNVKKHLNDIEKLLEKPNTPENVKTQYAGYIQEIQRTLRLASGNVLFEESLQKLPPPPRRLKIRKIIFKPADYLNFLSFSSLSQNFIHNFFKFSIIKGFAFQKLACDFS